MGDIMEKHKVNKCCNNDDNDNDDNVMHASLWWITLKLEPMIYGR